jgi:hypothetical protein
VSKTSEAACDSASSFQRSPGLFLNSSDFVLPNIACRPLHSWSEWHGGESLGVKTLETVNTVPIAFAAAIDVMGRAGPAKRISACAWSWVIAFVVLAMSSAQWFAVGTAIDRLAERWR